jgi:hypothetical protein
LAEFVERLSTVLFFHSHCADQIMIAIVGELFEMLRSQGSFQFDRPPKTPVVAPDHEIAAGNPIVGNDVGYRRVFKIHFAYADGLIDEKKPPSVLRRPLRRNSCG